MVLAHTILALEGGKPARVECNTCHGQHNYRPGTPEARPSSSSSRTNGTTGGTSRTRATFDEVMAQKSASARTYSPKITFALDETVSHPTFGRGFVAAVRADKIDVTFRNGTKTLVHGRA
jgi:hypothetical protein